jgi:hypothetical protein
VVWHRGRQIQNNFKIFFPLPEASPEKAKIREIPFVLLLPDFPEKATP